MQPTDFPLTRITRLIDDLHHHSQGEHAHSRALRRGNESGSGRALEAAVAYQQAAHLAYSAYSGILADLDRAAAQEATGRSGHPWPIPNLENVRPDDRIYPKWGITSEQSGTILYVHPSPLGSDEVILAVDGNGLTITQARWEALNTLARRCFAGEPIPWNEFGDVADRVQTGGAS